MQSICDDKDARERIVKSYEMMLDFYGLKLVDKATGLRYLAHRHIHGSYLCNAMLYSVLL